MGRRRHRVPLRRIRRLLRARPRLSLAQWAAIAAMVVATAGFAVAIAVLTRPGPVSRPQPSGALTSDGAPALLPSLPFQPTTAPGVASVPTTVRLIVPAGNIDISVIEGDGVHVPLNRAMHYPGTSEPGAGSNSLFYAHGQQGMFLGLYQVHTGDEIRAVRADGTVVRFRVSDIHRVPWDDLDILKPTSQEQVILLTCTSYNPHDPRYLVIGTLG